LGTGARISEIVALRWEDVDLKAGRVRLIPGKGKHGRTLPISATAGAILNNAEGRIGPIFLGQTRDRRPLRKALLLAKPPGRRLAPSPPHLGCRQRSEPVPLAGENGRTCRSDRHTAGMTTE
jgi:integrase